jgi:hypothetical protein
MALFDIAGDAARAFDVLRSGGIAIVPNDIGYSALGGSKAALEKIFVTKRRPPQKLNAMVANMAIHRELHACSARGRQIVDAIVGDYDLPLGCIGPTGRSIPCCEASIPKRLPPAASAARWSCCSTPAASTRH